ncbi:MAG: hypothetical protein ACI4SC_03925 [Candidatus Neoclostridium sp.]
MPDRIRRCKDRQEFEHAVDDYVTLNYKVLSRGEDSASLRQRKPHTKHLLVFLLTFWFTFGIGNLIYALIPLYGETVFVKIDQ